MCLFDNLKTLGILILFMCNISNAYAQNQKPNVLLINVDDLGWKDVGFMGSSYFETPNIDQLSKEGMVFTQGYATAANCAPSRACLMSGQNTPRHGVYTVANSDRGHIKTRKIIPVTNTRHISNEVVTMAEMFKMAGYKTGTFGKWHITKNPLNDGFDVNIGGNGSGGPGKDGYTAPYNGKPNLEIAPIGENLTDRLTSETIQFIKNHQQHPFFVYLPYYAVHTPLMAKDSLLKKYQNKTGAKSKDHPVYAAMVENTDTNIGRLLHVLDELKLSNNTIIVFTSDNGGIRAISSQDPLRAGKGSYYEGGIRVPYIFKWPKIIEAGSTNDTSIVNMDLFPTFMKMLNVKLPDKILDGVDIMPLLKGKKIEERALYWHFPIYLQAYSLKEDDGRDPLFRTRPGAVILYKNWKLHQYFEDDGLELYNLTTDLGERNNLLETNRAKAKELLNMMESWRKEMNAPLPTEPNPEYDPTYNPQQ